MCTSACTWSSIQVYTLRTTCLTTKAWIATYNCKQFLQVNHSQRMSEKPLVPWTMHSWKEWENSCCPLRLYGRAGGACTHVASLLWATAAGIEKRDSLTVTQKSAYWVKPPAIKTVPYAPLSEIGLVGNLKAKEYMHHWRYCRGSTNSFKKSTILCTIWYRKGWTLQCIS